MDSVKRVGVIGVGHLGQHHAVIFIFFFKLGFHFLQILLFFFKFLFGSLKL